MSPQASVETIEITPRGPFSLEAARSFAGGFAPGIGGGGPVAKGIVMAFPVEGWEGSAAAHVTQDASGVVRVRIATTGGADSSVALGQVLRCLSLDHDGGGWTDVGLRDPVIGRLQERHDFLRPVCFYSAYEAVTSFVIGQRIARRQGARIKAGLADRMGDRIELDGTTYVAFPGPRRLAELAASAELGEVKASRLRGLADAALQGRLNTERLRALPRDDAIAELLTLNGVGQFTAEGTYLRGCGIVDEIPRDALDRDAIAEMYGLPSVDDTKLAAITDGWRPYRMWATVLLRVGWERARPGRSYRQPPAPRPG